MSSDQVLARGAPREPADGFSLGEAAVQRSLDAARAADHAGLHTAVLDIVAVLAVGGVRRALLHAAGQTGVLVRDRRVPADEVDRALTRLGDRSLLTLSPDGQTVSMPVPVAQLVRAGLARAAPLTTVCRAAASALEAQAEVLAESPDEAADGDIPEQVAALRENAGPAAESDEQLAVVLLRLRSRVLYQLIERGDSAPQVIDVGEPLTAELERVLGPHHPDTLNARDSLAAAYQAAGRFAEAIPLFEDTLVARERILGPKHPSTLTSQNNLAAAYHDAGRHAEAILLFKLTLAARERLLGPDHPSTLTSGASLAAAFRATGRVSEAIPLLEQTVAGGERVLGADHPDVRTARENLAGARQEKDQTDDTIRLVLLAQPLPAVEQQPAEEQSAEQESSAESVPGLVESLAAPSSDDAAPEPIPESPVAPVDEEKLSADPATVDLSAAVAAAETGSQAPPEPAPVPGSELEPPAPQDVREPTLPAEEPPVAVVAAEPSAPPAAEERLAEEPPSAAAPVRAAPWWRPRKRAINRRLEPVSVPEPELQAPQDASEPTPPAEEPPASRAVVEPSAAPADGEEPAAVAAAETGDQPPPEPEPVPRPEPEPEPRQDVSEPTPSAEEPPAIPAMEEAAAEEPLTTPLPEEPAAAAGVESAAAIPLLEQTVAGGERVLGADHPDVRTARENLAGARQEKDQTDDTIRLVLLAQPLPAVEQQPAEEQSAEQESSAESVPGLVESLAAPSSDDAAPEPIPESPVAPVDEKKLSAEPATVDLSAAVAAAETGSQAPPEPVPVPEPEPEARQDVPEPPPPTEEPPAAAATVDLSAAVAAAETGDQPPLEPAPVPGSELEPPAPQGISQPTPPAEEPPVAMVAAAPSAPPPAEERLAEEPPSTAAPLRAVPWWQLRKRAIKSRPEPVSVPEPEPELQASQDSSEPTPPAEEPRASRAVVEPSAAPADGEEPAAVAAAETGDQVPPEPVSAPEPEPEPQDVSEPTPPAEAPPASQAAEEPLAAAAVEEAAAEAPPDAPLPEEPPAVAAEVEPAAAPADGEEPAAVAAAEPSASQAAEELLAAAAVGETAAEKPPDAPLPEELPAVAAEVEPAAAPADGEEPAEAAAETGDQASPEPAPVPDREPEQDVSEPTPLAEEPSAAAPPEEPPAPSVEEPAAEEPPDAPPAEEQPAVPAAEEPSAPPEGRRPAPALDRPARRRRRVLSLAAAVVVVLAAGGVAGYLSRPHAGHSGHGSAASRSAGSQPLSAAFQLAAVWVAQQVAPSTIVACDPQMCSALEVQGVAAANLLVLRPDATSPLGAQVIVVTPAVRSQFGSRMDSVYAPSVIAGFGSGPGQVSVQIVAQDGPTAYLTALRQDAADRKTAGAQLLANKHIQASAEARAQLAAGAVDSRLLIMLPALAAVHPIQVLAFGHPAPGAGPGVPLCSADLSGSGQAASMSDVSYLRWLTSFVGTQLVPFAGSVSVLQEAGQPIVRVVFAQPSPLGLLSHT